MMFLKCRTQWRVGGMGTAIGMDYGAVMEVLRLYEVKDQRRVLEGLQVMEAAVLGLMAKREAS